MQEKRRAILIAGPTASGKSALAIEKAEAVDGIIVNCDSMQVYDVLNVLTARPPKEDLDRVPHHLYGFLSPAERFSTGAWLSSVREVIDNSTFAMRPLVFVGGTGLYFDALLNGVAAVPEVPREVVEKIETEIAGLDRQRRGDLLTTRDPLMAARIVEPDRQRVVRALSVLESTGKSLAEWQDAGQTGLLDDFGIERFVLNPDRDVLRERIARRFHQMMAGEAVSEVEALMKLDLDPSLPAMKAIGVREIDAWLRDEMTRDEAVERSIIATHQYAKRQRTWFRNRMGDWTFM